MSNNISITNKIIFYFLLGTGVGTVYKLDIRKRYKLILLFSLFVIFTDFKFDGYNNKLHIFIHVFDFVSESMFWIN
jgi:hypothetical protein